MWFVLGVRNLSRQLTWLLMGASLVVTGACGGSQASEGGGVLPDDPRRHATRALARWNALAMSHRKVRARLGGHRFEATHRVDVTVDNKPVQGFQDRYWLRCTRQGLCHGKLHNSLEYGVEFIRLADYTYFRHRYQKYLRFTEEPEEATRRIEDLWGAGRAVVDLLRAQLTLSPDGQAKASGREASRYRLTLASVGRPRDESGARAWRNKMRVLKIEGHVLLDNATGVPLELQVSYAVSAPRKSQTLVITGSFRGAIRDPGRPPEIRPPSSFVEAKPRDRTVLQERRLLSNYRLNPGWFRGGGPARRGSMGAPVRAMSRPRPRPRPRPVMRRPVLRPMQ